MKKLLATSLFLLFSSMAPLAAQQAVDSEAAAVAVERLLGQQGTASISTFVDQYMGAVEDRKAVIAKIGHIRKELAELLDNVGLDLDDAGAILTLASNGVEKRLRIQYDQSRQRVTDLFILPPEEKLTFDLTAPDAIVQYLQEQGMAGLIYLEADGGILLETPFGMANDVLEVPNRTTTIFAIGSRPIDFTRAAITLLDQQGKLSLDDSLGKHLDNVPPDKQAITLRHLMTGASGLPDFFDNEADWDPDLQWVSREEAIRRMLGQALLFEPGQGRAHSHAAFGLLAAIVELTSRTSYMDFLNEHFFGPAGMQRTGEYGERKDFALADFAVGGGPQFVGLPNIPPNWGPTSWLVKGSGGMYSTLDDLRNFYALVRYGEVFDAQHARYFQGATADVDGSVRGFELFSAFFPQQGEVYLFLNKPGDRAVRRKIFRALEDLID